MGLANRSRSTVGAGVLALALVVAASAGPAAAQDPTVAPSTTLSADGRTVSGAGRSLTASQVQGLAAGGESVTVSGAGYDVQKGVYLALCVIPPTNQPPSPCGGGQDITGSSGASAWISSNPPDYAGGLAQPYGAGGTFTVSIGIGAAISPGLDCTMVRCAIVTRNDHTRGSDRSQDLFIPVTFATSGSQPPPPTPTTAPPPVVTTTTSTTSTLPPAPPTTLAADGRSVSNGTQVLSVSDVGDLDPTGASVTVEGEGFDPAAGIYVALCRVPEAGQAPGPCSAGEGQAAWVATDPPDFGAAVAQPFEEGGRFAVELQLLAVIDETTDCREVPCAVATRRDDTAAADRTLDLLVPVAFADEATTTTTEASGDAAAAPTATSGGDSGGSGAAVAIGAVALVAAVVGGTVAVRRRRSTA